MKKFYFFLAILFAIYYITAVYNTADWDLWARLAVGSIFFQTGSVLKHDIFAYTPTKPLWIDHEWGSGVIFYYLTHYFGDNGLLILKFVILAFIFILIFKTNQLRSNGENPYRIGYYFVFLFGILLAFDNIIRSHCFTYLFFALWLYLLDQIKLGRNRLIWIFPATMLIWANLHGGFVAGLGIVTLYGIGEAINKRSYRKYFAILAMSLLATLINPYGLKYWSFIIDAVSMPRPYVGEWDPVNLFGSFFQLPGFKIFVILTLFCLPYLFIKRIKEINWAEILILGVTFYLSLKHMRHVIFFVIAAGSYIYNYLYAAFDWYTTGMIGKFYSLFPVKLRTFSKRLREIIVYSLIVLIGFGILTFLPRKVRVRDQMFPTKAVKFIQQNDLRGNLVVLFNWGSYALWKLYPQCLIAIDGRYEEVYPNTVTDDIARLHYVGVGWDGLLRKYPADIMLIPVEYEDLYKKILSLNDWKLIYKDRLAAVFIPKSRDKRNWIHPAQDFDIDKEKFKTNIKF